MGEIVAIEEDLTTSTHRGRGNLVAVNLNSSTEHLADHSPLEESSPKEIDA